MNERNDEFCQTGQKLLNAAIDGGNLEENSFVRHVQHCETCQKAAAKAAIQWCARLAVVDQHFSAIGEYLSST